MLKQIHMLNRGIPDQEVLKQVFLTLRNIARYPHPRQVLVNTPESAKIIFQELLRYLYAVRHIRMIAIVINSKGSVKGVPHCKAFCF